jgi:hypothetical protein
MVIDHLLMVDGVSLTFQNIDLVSPTGYPTGMRDYMGFRATNGGNIEFINCTTNLNNNSFYADDETFIKILNLPSDLRNDDLIFVIEDTDVFISGSSKLIIENVNLYLGTGTRIFIEDNSELIIINSKISGSGILRVEENSKMTIEDSEVIVLSFGATDSEVFFQDSTIQTVNSGLIRSQFVMNNTTLQSTDGYSTIHFSDLEINDSIFGLYSTRIIFSDFTNGIFTNTIINSNHRFFAIDLDSTLRFKDSEINISNDGNLWIMEGSSLYLCDTLLSIDMSYLHLIDGFMKLTRSDWINKNRVEILGYHPHDRIEITNKSYVNFEYIDDHYKTIIRHGSIGEKWDGLYFSDLRSERNIANTIRGSISDINNFIVTRSSMILENLNVSQINKMEFRDSTFVTMRYSTYELNEHAILVTQSTGVFDNLISRSNRK